MNKDKWSRKLPQLPGDKKQTYESVEKRKVDEQRKGGLEAARITIKGIKRNQVTAVGWKTVTTGAKPNQLLGE